MERPLLCALLVSLLLVPLVVSEREDVRRSLVDFLRALSANDSRVEHDLGWNISTDPCGWEGVICDSTKSTRRIVLRDLRLRGSIDAGLLCKVPSLVNVDISGNSLLGGIPPEISECTLLTHLLLPGNRLSGSLPSSLAALKYLKKLDISQNSFSGVPPNMGRISGLVVFLVQNNHLSGEIPRLQFSILQLFDVSHNNFSGPIPAEAASRFELSKFTGNPGLCGRPYFPACPTPPGGRRRGEAGAPAPGGAPVHQ